MTESSDSIGRSTTSSGQPQVPLKRWEVYCRVIDNLGDIGVCWRLCRNLAARGVKVRLWIDVPDDLVWMAPGALEGDIENIDVVHWTEPMSGSDAAVVSCVESDVWIEAFGCDPPPACLASLAHHLQDGGKAPAWLNLEYMSAEAYVERCHRLPSPIMSGPLTGQTKHFFYPGFTPATGGLLREPALLTEQAAFDPGRWREANAAPGQAGASRTDARRVSLFCYGPTALPAVLDQAGQASEPSEWFITPGWASRSLDAYLSGLESRGESTGPSLRLHRLGYVTQPAFDHMLWSCDLNFVRGEDSLVRALWAGKPFVWHIYPQDDLAHHAKLDAFLDWLQAPACWRDFHYQWNAIDERPVRWPGWSVIDTWAETVLQARERLLQQEDLVTQLIRFVGRG